MSLYAVETTDPAPDGTRRARLVLPTGGASDWTCPISAEAVEHLRHDAELMSAAFRLGVSLGAAAARPPAAPRNSGSFSLTTADVDRASRLHLRVVGWVAAAAALALVLSLAGLADLSRERWHGPAVWGLWAAVAAAVVVLVLAAVARLAVAATLAECDRRRRGEVRS